jgi:hypothetical protein
VVGDWIRLHNEEFHNLYAPPNIIKVNKSRRLRWARYVAHKIFVRAPEGKRPLRRPKRTWENNIRMNLTEIWWEGVD